MNSTESPDSTRRPVEPGAPRRKAGAWKAGVAGLAIFSALLGLLTTIFFAGDIDTAFIAAWTAVALLGLGFAVVVFGALAYLVSPRGEAVSGSSAIAVAFAFAVAAVAAPLAVESTVHGVDRVFSAAFVLTPTLVLRATHDEALCPCPQARPADKPIAPNASTAGSAPPPAPTTPPAQSAAPSSPKTGARSSEKGGLEAEKQQLSLKKAEIISYIFTYIADGQSPCLAKEACPCPDTQPTVQTMAPVLDQVLDSDSDIGRGARIWFMIVLGVGLLLGRTFAESRRDWYEQQEQEERETEEAPAFEAKKPIITYPKWIAATVYAAILGPASYLAIGALLFLSLDSAAIDQGEFKKRLDAAESRAMSSDIMDKSDVATGQLLQIAIASAESPDTPQAASFGAIKNAVLAYYELQTQLEALRRDEKRLMIEKLNESSRTYPPSKVADYADYLVETYYNSTLMARSRVRTCLSGLSPIQAIIGKSGKPEEVAASLSRAQDLIRALPEKCPTTNPKPEVLFVDGDQPPRGSVVESVMFGWMIGMPKTTLLIIGLLGFGLFGAAIRMLGRPDRPEVLPRSEDDKALQDMVQDLLERAAAVRAETTDNQPEDTEVRRKRLCEIAALKALTIQINALARQEHAERNNIIYSRSEYSIDHWGRMKVRERVAVSGAPARVLVHGMGAAFTVFLMGESGSRFFNDGGKTSPIGLVALCFIGAVFAETIWQRAHEFLGKQTTPSPHPTGGPSPPVNLPKDPDGPTTPPEDAAAETPADDPTREASKTGKKS